MLLQVILSSSAHKRSTAQLDDLDFSKRGYDPWAAYGQSKTANIWMATEIERRYGSQGLHRSYACACRVSSCRLWVFTVHLPQQQRQCMPIHWRRGTCLAFHH